MEQKLSNSNFLSRLSHERSRTDSKTAVSTTSRVNQIVQQNVYGSYNVLIIMLIYYLHMSRESRHIARPVYRFNCARTAANDTANAYIVKNKRITISRVLNFTLFVY